MMIKIFQIELEGLIHPFHLEEGYDYYRGLIRIKKLPVGWISFTRQIGACSISAEEIHRMVREQLGLTHEQQGALNSFEQTAASKKTTGISVVVCTRNRTKQLARCIQSLLLLDYLLYEIIVVDNAPDQDDTYEFVKDLPVRYVREERPGLDWARNRGVAEARYSIVAFTDDDTIVDPYWLQAIEGTFADQEIMAASGYVAPAELDSYAQRVFELQYGGMGHGFLPRVLGKERLSSRTLLWVSNLVIGANMAFRKSVFDEVVGFDTSLDVGTPSRGGGDIEIFHRLLSRHKAVAYVPAMLIWHYHRKHLPALKKQLSDNGRSFGCFLINCYRNKTVSKSSIIRFFIIDWLIKWNLRNLLKQPGGIPMFVSLAELKGMVASPYAYIKTKACDKKLRRRSWVHANHAVACN